MRVPTKMKIVFCALTIDKTQLEHTQGDTVKIATKERGRGHRFGVAPFLKGAWG